MFKQHSCNMKPKESYIRSLIATVFLLYAIVSSSIFLTIISVIIYYTAFTKFCFVYYIFKINEKFSIKNYYLSLLPKYRTSPVFIFDNTGQILFKNRASKTLLSHVHSVRDIQFKEYEEIIKQGQTKTSLIEYSNKFYQIELQGIKKEEFLLAYFTDVTEVIELNDAIEETQREVIYAMGEIGETRSKETGNHVKRVANYSKELALLYGLSQKEADLLHMASPMHDIGKV